MMVVFLGPSLPLDVARTELDAVYRGPVAQGDVYRAVTAVEPLESIGIIDGQFDHVPAVWHKEILWAMDWGVHVYGSASMGALRAAELHAFGMEGVGEIFESLPGRDARGRRRSGRRARRGRHRISADVGFHGEHSLHAARGGAERRHRVTRADDARGHREGAILPGAVVSGRSSRRPMDASIPPSSRPSPRGGRRAASI